MDIKKSPLSINDMKKNIQIQEGKWVKEKALMGQKIQLLNMELQESRIREDNLRSMNETIM